MSDALSIPSIGLEACARLLEASAASCLMPASQPVNVAPQPNWDAMATALSQMSTAIAFGSLGLGLVGLLGALSWAGFVTRKAEKEARAEAEKCAKKLIERWLAEEAPSIVRKQVDMLQDASLGGSDDDQAADEMGEVAG